MKLISIAMVAIALGGTAGAQAQVVDKFNITPEEQLACQADATTLCRATFPDEDALISCMKANVGNLTPYCRQTFTIGLRRRHM